MKYKKIFAVAVSLTIFVSVGNRNVVSADEFSGKEDKYIILCSSSKLTTNNQNTCKRFNNYLKEKNSKITKEIEESNNIKVDAETNIKTLEEKITELDKEISESNKEISYLENSIKNLESNIKTKKELLKERLYSMQSTMNSNMFVEYLFGAADFTDFLSRTSQISEITKYDNGLINEINKDIEESKSQKNLLDEHKKTLDLKKKTQEDLQNEYLSKLQNANANISDLNNQKSSNVESMDKINKNLEALEKASQESQLGNVNQATNDKKPSKPNKPSNSNNSSNNSNNSNNSNSSNSSENKPNNNPNNDNSNNQIEDKNDNISSDSIELGLKIANKALTRQGYMYVWGGAHNMTAIKDPNHTEFDCSGLVNWAYYQSGVNIGVQYTGSLVYMGKKVEKEDLQAGDIILFSDNGTVSGVHHVGIYIGGNRMVHAPTTGKPIQVADLNNSYWQREWLVARRLY